MISERNGPSQAGNGGSLAHPDATSSVIQWRWLPPTLAVLAMLLLFAIPYLLSIRVKDLRVTRLAGSERARVLLNDLEAAFATQLLIRKSASPKTLPTYANSVHLDSDAVGLHSAVGNMGPQAAQLEYDLAARLSAWKQASNDESTISEQDGLDLLASAERLDEFLTKEAAAQRDEAERLERYYLITPALLSPIAVFAIVLIIASARRERRYARIANAERAQVVLAAESRAALLRGVTHDVKNPLGAAAGYAQLLEEGIVGDLLPKQREMITRINSLVHTAVQTVSDLLELARADGELHIAYTEMDISTAVNDIVQDHHAVARGHQIKITVDVARTTLVADPIRVRQILANLLSNAIKYTPAGGRVDVRLVAVGDAAGQPNRIGVEVRDNGPGIPPELSGKLFEEFFRVRNANATSIEGNGLGLAISRRVARLMAGDITFENASGGGSAFTLWLTAAGRAT